ncbi:MAG: methyltransferase domain-containing protein [Thermoanaerobacterales bacterium]|nr:methyltransferase domain-containing protein [Bacillota bacterium]MDI6907210.1 methyltransferase domain-containing protein [Thermoanaerobacterales bacterium]
MEKETVKRVYTAGASQYDSLMQGDWDRDTPRGEVVGCLELQPGQSMLDVCVGTGLNFPHYPPGVGVTGIDFTEAMLDVAGQKAAGMGLAVNLVNMDATKMTFPDESFDGILATYAISVVPEPLQAMREMARVCKPGGRIAIWDSVLSDIPYVAGNQYVINHFTSKYGYPEGVIVFSITLDFPALIEQIPELKVDRFTRYDRENPLKSRCLIKLIKA